MKVTKVYKVTVEFTIDDPVVADPVPMQKVKDRQAELEKRTIQNLKNTDIITWYGETAVIDVDEV